MNTYAIFYLLLIQVSLLLPGYVLVKKSKLLSKNPGLELSFSYLVTMVLFGFFATIDYAFKFSPGLSRLLCWGIIIYSLVEFFRVRYDKDLLKLRFPLICLVLMSIFSSAFISLTFSPKYTYVPDPVARSGRNYHVLNVKVLNVAQTQANDNYIPYRQAQFFINRSDPARDSFIGEWGVTFFQRTPLMGAVTANYFNLFHEKVPVNYTWSNTESDPSHTYLQFQLIAGILNAIFIIPAFFLLIKLFNKKAALITCLFLITGQFFLYNAVFSWPKSLVAFFVLLSWLLLLENRQRYTVMAGVASGIAYLTHDLAVLYIGASLLLLLWNRRFRDTLQFGAILSVFMLPWILVSDLLYHKPSSFILYPLSTGGIPQISQKQLIIHQFLHTSPLRIIFIRAENFIYLLSPYQLLTSEGGQGLLRRLWALGLYSIPGAIGIGLIGPAVLGALKNLRNINFWILALAPVILSTVVIGWPKGLGALHFAEAVTVLLSGLGIYYLLRLKNRWWLLAAFVVNCLQLLLFVAYSYRFAVGVWFTHPADILRLVVMAIIVIFCGWAIYKTANGQKTWIVA